MKLKMLFSIRKLRRDDPILPLAASACIAVTAWSSRSARISKKTAVAHDFDEPGSFSAALVSMDSSRAS